MMPCVPVSLSPRLESVNSEINREEHLDEISFQLQNKSSMTQCIQRMTIRLLTFLFQLLRFRRTNRVYCTLYACLRAWGGGSNSQCGMVATHTHFGWVTSCCCCHIPVHPDTRTISTTKVVDVRNTSTGISIVIRVIRKILDVARIHFAIQTV